MISESAFRGSINKVGCKRVRKRSSVPSSPSPPFLDIKGRVSRRGK